MSRKHVALWANSPQRVASYLPLAKAVVQFGHACKLYHDSGFKLDPADLADLTGVDVEPTSASKLRRAASIDVFVSSEAMWEHVPEAGVKVAVMHSLPDRDILYSNYSRWLRERPTLVANFDYMVVPVVQRAANWTREAYQPYVDAARSHPGRAVLPDFSVIPGGYPKTNYLDAKFSQPAPLDTIIYCPTISTNRASSLIRCGAEILRTLHDTFPGHRLVFRPYPTDDRKTIDDVVARAGHLARLEIDRSLTGVEHQLRATLAVTDKSSAAISFSISSGRPAIFFEPEDAVLPSGITENPIGYLVRGLDSLAEGCQRAVTEASALKQKIAETRANMLYRPFDSSTYLASCMETIADGRAESNWLVVPRN